MTDKILDFLEALFVIEGITFAGMVELCTAEHFPSNLGLCSLKWRGGVLLW